MQQDTTQTQAGMQQSATPALTDGTQQGGAQAQVDGQQTAPQPVEGQQTAPQQGNLVSICLLVHC